LTSYDKSSNAYGYIVADVLSILSKPIQGDCDKYSFIVFLAYIFNFIAKISFSVWDVFQTAFICLLVGIDL
jgi:hypothetical protein